MARNSWKWVEVVVNGWNGCKLLEMAGNVWKGWKWLEWLKIYGNGWKLLEIAGNYWNGWK